ncbi:ArsR/SmtB family transcription factor [Anaerocolumna xylanovorans]|uniref:ArsR family transcriptional regulator n=1 Tax=Anaerocolumna xylanovorans DSM 12503 TaxID=1121345 RepID=A0A1M7YIA1_9FIRM|nr:metalloregulator ArsR/SmtB family transcription factor [Anaerocolumna xylanovorans]SHO52355.1 ArsR family transcriptional regulator [Anaerocolumna xylanovorans DSM 12503]
MDRHLYADCCDETLVHEGVIEEVKSKYPNEEKLYDLAELFKAFGDTTRIRILYALFEANMCVCDISEVLDMKQSAISHQLRVLKQANLVKSQRDGKSIIYSLADEHVKTMVEQGMSHISEGKYI